MSKAKTIIAVIAVIAVTVAAIALWWFTRPENQDGGNTNAPTGTLTNEEGIGFTVIVVHADGSEKTFTYKTEKEYVGQVLLEEGLVEGTQESYGLYVKVVDGEQAIYEEDSAYWAFYSGEELSLVGVDQTPVAEGAVYKLVYTPA